MQFELDQKVFVTSSFSARSDRCVGVSIQDEKVFVTNSKSRISIVSFSHEEWTAFIFGVKQGEFDLEKE